MTNEPAGPPPNDARLTLTTLGAWSLTYSSSGQPLTTLLGPGKPLALLVYLALAPGRTVRREHLLDLLWADVEPDAASHSMRQTIWLIRRRLGREVLKVAGDTVLLAATVETDRDAFLAAVQAQHVEAAFALYRGEFLPSFAAPGGAEFERWADLERDRLRAQFVHAAQTLVRHKLAAGQSRDALACARRARDADRSIEASWRLVLEACVSANDALGAALEADQLEWFFAAESREPEPATRALLRAVRHAPEGEEEAGGRSLVAELVGREREFAAILAAWAGARRSPGRHLRVTGGPGLGKTRLLHDILARLRATGARALYVRANPGARHVAYAFVSDLATQVAALPGAIGISPGSAATLVGLNPALASRFAAAAERADGDEMLRHRTSALVELLSAAAAESPVALLLDDVHWADGASRQVLRGVLPKLEGFPALVVSASRPGAGDDLAAPGDDQVALQPLTESESTALLASLASIPNEPWWGEFCVALHAGSRGVPLLALEMLQLAMERGHLVRDEAGWRCTDREALLGQVSAGGPLRHRIAQLGREEGRLLLLLALAGTPLGVGSLAAAAGRGAEDVDEDVNHLEQRGLLARVGGEWEPAHDEISRLVEEQSAPDAAREAHAALGTLFARQAAENPQVLPRCAQHLLAGGREPAVGDVLRRWVAQARRSGDRRSLRSLAAELMGEGARPGAAGRLVRRLPAHVRLGLDTPRRIASAAALTLLVAAGATALALRTAREPDAVLVVLRPAGADSATPVGIPLYRDAPASGALDVRRPPRTVTVLPKRVAMLRSSYEPQPGGDQWLFVRTAPDSGGEDVFLLRPDGTERRLTASRGDDLGPHWSPDGARIAFSTDRWSTESHSNVAVMDLATGRVQRLTSGEARDVYPVWSPDGTRIAFVRTYYSDRASEVCWVAADGSATRCFATPGFGPHKVSGWRDADSLVVEGEADDGSGLTAMLDLVSGHRSGERRAQWSWLSADGRWLLCACSGGRSDQAALRLIPLERPERASLIEPDSLTDEQSLVIRIPAGRTRPFLSRLVIRAPADGTVPLGAPYRLLASGLDSRGDPAPDIPVLTWRSADPTVATVDTLGVVHPVRTGDVTITASAGGWRKASTQLRVRVQAAAVVMAEDWSRGLDQGWRPFGDPLPLEVVGPGGTEALWHHGDSSFASGVYSRRSFDGPAGLAVELRLSTPVDRLTWQNVNVDLEAAVDSAALERWDHRTGAPPDHLDVHHSCGTGFPGGEGARNLGTVTVTAATSRRVAVEPALRSGRWWTLRLQIFPDGRCGVAVNGRARAILPEPLRLERPFLLFLQGYSYHTRMLVGPLTVWEGVPGGVDWERAGRAEPGSVARAGRGGRNRPAPSR
ncbi:MAG TPA: AAA family ATPase [Gemmatimonadales bacterium]|nr:AAA family ATPase [Gemmatimonadales bacterium]